MRIGAVSRRKLLVGILVAALYLVTWFNGCASHTRALREHARRLYDETIEHDLALARFAAENGLTHSPTELRRNGPRVGVEWCLPVLPGVLLADSWYLNGPLFAEGSWKIVLYYGFGSATLIELTTWRS